MTSDASVGGAERMWRPTVAHYRSGGVSIMLIAAALLFRRPDLLVVAAPLSVITVWSIVTRPTRIPSFRDRLGRSTLREGEATTWRTEVVGADDADMATVAVADMRWFERRPSRGSMAVAVRGGAVTMAIVVRSTRWGRRFLEPVRATASSRWGAFRCTVSLPPQPVVTVPLPAPFDGTAPARPADGLVGSYRSVRQGEGSEFAAVRRFQIGDRMRRINWSRSLRSESLQVNSTSADHDTHVALVVDTLDDLGVSEGFEGRSSSLDVTVRAAGAIAEHYVQRGDRVSLGSFDPSARLAIPPGTGQGHLRRLLDTLARVNAPTGRISGPRRPPMSNPDVTLVLTPLVAPDGLERAVALGRAGRSVVVVDTLPEDVVVDEDPLFALAWRIRLLERKREFRRARQLGIAVVRWVGPGSLDPVLREVSRRSGAPRIRA